MASLCPPPLATPMRKPRRQYETRRREKQSRRQEDGMKREKDKARRQKDKILDLVKSNLNRNEKTKGRVPSILLGREDEKTRSWISSS